MKKLILIVILVVSNFINAQNNQKQVEQVQPKIMVVPHVKEGEDIRTVLENDKKKRFAISAVKEAFDSRGYTTYDFTQSLKIALQDMHSNSNMKTDLKTQIVQMSGADIYVEVEVNYEKTSSGNYVDLILEAKDAFTGQSLANKTGESGKFYSDNVAKLAKMAVNSVIEDFLDVMNQKFGQIVKNGRSVFLTILIDENSDITFDSEVGSDGDILSDLIEDWLDEHAYKNNYHVQGITENKFLVDDFRIPLRDERGKNYKARKVLRDLKKYVKQLGLQSKYGIKTESKIELIIL